MITPVAHTVSLPLRTLVAAVASIHTTVCCRIFCDVVDVVNVVDVFDAVNDVTVFVVVVVNVVISVVVDDRCRYYCWIFCAPFGRNPPTRQRIVLYLGCLPWRFSFGTTMFVEISPTVTRRD